VETPSGRGREQARQSTPARPAVKRGRTAGNAGPVEHPPCQGPAAAPPRPRRPRRESDVHPSPASPSAAHPEGARARGEDRPSGGSALRVGLVSPLHDNALRAGVGPAAPTRCFQPRDDDRETPSAHAVRRWSSADAERRRGSGDGHRGIGSGDARRTRPTTREMYGGAMPSRSSTEPRSRSSSADARRWMVFDGSDDARRAGGACGKTADTQVRAYTSDGFEPPRAADGREKGTTPSRNRPLSI
jgi:hypothetical protein